MADGARPDWIELTRSEDGRLLAWFRCPACAGIVHLQEIGFPARVSRSPSGRELRAFLACEEGHQFVLELEDHSGTMMLSERPLGREY